MSTLSNDYVIRERIAECYEIARSLVWDYNWQHVFLCNDAGTLDSFAQKFCCSLVELEKNLEKLAALNINY